MRIPDSSRADQDESGRSYEMIQSSKSVSGSVPGITLVVYEVSARDPTGRTWMSSMQNNLLVMLIFIYKDCMEIVTGDI